MSTLIAYGHSYVQGDGASAASRRFVDLAAAKLGCVLKNNGVGGSFSTQTAALVRVNPPAVADIYVLMTGVNDARLHGWRMEALAQYTSALETIFDAFGEANPLARVIAVEQPSLSDYSQHAPYDKGSDALVDVYNQRLREVAAQYPRVALTPVGAWDKTLMVAADTVHPNDLGHRAIADAVCHAAGVLPSR
ncbi:SGNH/GDSL hydrolase family protein [Micromonospora sp. DT47]|uniref:SGNH/GDSL hydrolase family protein n=1 Tax=Micromonospora sp. DT47 TaxID=3393431 RepID=UPI003CF36408